MPGLVVDGGGGEMGEAERIEFSPEHLRFPGMSQCVRVGSLAFVSGQVALGPDGEPVAPGDAAAQSEQCFRNLAAALEGVGMSIGDVVKLTCHLADAEHYPAYASAKAKFMQGASPAATAVVSQLLNPGFCLEVEAVAAVASSAGR